MCSVSARSGCRSSILYAHAALFLLAAAWTLKEGGHVRVDVFYAQATPRAKAWVDLCGALFLLLPFALAILVFALPYVERSWATLERSRETSGLPLVFLLKTLIPLFALLLALQGVAQAIRAVSLAYPSPEAGRVDASVARAGWGRRREAKPHPARFAADPSPSGEGWALPMLSPNSSRSSW